MYELIFRVQQYVHIAVLIVFEKLEGKKTVSNPVVFRHGKLSIFICLQLTK